MKKVIWWQTKTKFIILIVTSFVFGTHHSCLLAMANTNRGRTYSTSVVVLVLVQWQNQSYLSTNSGSVASSVWVLDLALISMLKETEQTEPHHEVVLKSTQFCQLSLDTHL